MKQISQMNAYDVLTMIFGIDTKLDGWAPLMLKILKPWESTLDMFNLFWKTLFF